MGQNVTLISYNLEDWQWLKEYAKEHRTTRSKLIERYIQKLREQEEKALSKARGMAKRRELHA